MLIDDSSLLCSNEQLEVKSDTGFMNKADSIGLMMNLTDSGPAGGF
jgi:hypothetical protein